MNGTRKRPESDNDDDEEHINVAEKRQRTPMVSDEGDNNEAFLAGSGFPVHQQEEEPSSMALMKVFEEKMGFPNRSISFHSSPLLPYNSTEADFSCGFPVHQQGESSLMALLMMKPVEEEMIYPNRSISLFPYNNVADFLAGLPVNQQEPRLMALKKASKEEMIFPNRSISVSPSSFPSLLPTINGNGESFGVISDSESKSSVSMGIGVAFMLYDNYDNLMDLSQRATSFVEEFVLSSSEATVKKEENGEEEVSSEDVEKWLLSSSEATIKTEEIREEESSFGPDKRVLSLPPVGNIKIEPEEWVEDYQKEIINGCDKLVLGSPDATIKTEEIGEKEEEKLVLGSPVVTIKTEEIGEKEEEKEEESGEDEQEEMINVCDLDDQIEESDDDDGWIERVLNEIAHAFGFQEVMMV